MASFSILRRLGIGCDHERIHIADIADNGMAVYRCKTCRRRIKPWEHDQNWVYDDG